MYNFHISIYINIVRIIQMYIFLNIEKISLSPTIIISYFK